MEWIDLRSDTVTQPTAAMRQAMAAAEVGDDVYGEDPTVNKLQEKAAELLGKEAALFVPSGTMGNLAAVLTHCGRGDEVILGDKAHQFIYEAGGMAALGGVQPRTVPNNDQGEMDLAQIEAAIRPDDVHHPVTRLIAYENTHNLCWGSVVSQTFEEGLRLLADAHGLAIHLDGARLFNAAAARQQSPAKVAAVADSVTFCLSKGLCAPVGSILCGSREFISKAKRIRKQLGGGMRQVGVLAAAGMLALDEMSDRLLQDHAHAQDLARRLDTLAGISVLNPEPASNMVYIQFDSLPADQVHKLVERAHQAGIKLATKDGRSMRLVTHYWIDDDALDQVVVFFERALGEGEN